MKRLAVLVCLGLLATSCSSSVDEETSVQPAPTTLAEDEVAATATATATAAEPAQTTTKTTTTTATTVAPTTTVQLITVPDLTGKTTAYAEGVLDTLGLGIYVEESPDLEGDSNVIQQQMPVGGTTVTPGSPVVVTVPAPQIRIPSLGVSLAGMKLLEEVGDLKAGQAATLQATRALRDNPAITHNPFGVIVEFREGATEDEINASLIAIGGSRVGKPLGLDNLFLVETLADPGEALVALGAEASVEEAGLDNVIRLNQFVNDPRIDDQWGLEQTPGLNLAEAWDIGIGEASVVVAVIDTGIQLDHPDLAANIWKNPGETPNNGIDDDNNGYVDDVNGWDFFNNDNDPDDDFGHGTHVAGTIGAVANNGIGVAGVTRNVQLMALKVFSASEQSFENSFYQALEYALINGAQVSNNSWGGPGENVWMERLIDDAGQVGHIFVASAGNAESNNDIYPTFPNSYPAENIISVAAIEESGGMAWFSNYGRSSVDVAAPGRNILSTVPGGRYDWLDGTSMAAPHVTGLVALMRSIQPNLVPSAIKNILIDTSVEDTRLRNLVVSGGVIDAAGAVRAITASLVPTTTVPPATTQPPTGTTSPTTTVGPTTTAGPTTTTSTTTTTTEVPRAPSAPGSLGVTWESAYSGPRINLDWFSPVDCGTEQCNYLRYRIERRTDGGPWTTASEVFGQQGTDTSFTNLDYAHTYNFRVLAVNGAGISPPSNTVSVTPVTVPSAPSLLEVCHVGETGNEWIATWGTNSGVPIYDGGSPITGFKLSWSGGQQTVGGSPQQFTAPSPGTVRVYTITSYGTSSGYASEYASSSTVCPGTESDPPSAPTGFTATLGEPVGSYNRTVVFSWQPPLDDGGQPVQDYNITYCEEAGAGLCANPNSYAWDDTCSYACLTNTTYSKYFETGITLYARVVARNMKGLGTYSETISIVVPDQISEPLNLATGDWPGVGVCWTCGPNQPGIVWSAPESGASAVLHYIVDVSADGGFNWTRDSRTFNTIQAVTGVGARYVATFDPVPSNTARFYRVAAVTATETGPWSATTSGTTPPVSVSNMTLSPSPAGIGHTVTVSWRIIQGGGTLPDSDLCTSGDFPIAVTVSRRWAPPEIDLGYDSTTGDCSGISRVSGNAYDGVYQTQFTVGSDWTSVDGGYVVEIDYTNPTSGGVQTQFTGTGWNVAAPPGPPSGWPSPTVSGQTIVFTWTEPESELPISHYVVSQSRVSTQWTWSVINDNYVDSARSVSVTADWGESVCFDVYAVAGGVNGATATSTPGTQYCGKPLTTPGVPTSFEVTQIAGASWSAPEFDGGCRGTGNDPSALDYEVQTSTDGTTYSGSYETTGTTLSSLNGPSWYEENQTRFYRVRAICDGDESEFSEVVSVVYEHTPGRISSLNCLGGWQGDGTRECSWTAPPSGGSPVTHYEMRYSYIFPDGSLEWTYISEPITGTTYTITGLTFGNYSDRYYIHVLAFNKWGATTRNRSNDRTGYWSNGMTASATEYWDN